MIDDPQLASNFPPRLLKAKTNREYKVLIQTHSCAFSKIDAPQAWRGFAF